MPMLATLHGTVRSLMHSNTIGVDYIRILCLFNVIVRACAQTVEYVVRARAETQSLIQRNDFEADLDQARQPFKPTRNPNKERLAHRLAHDDYESSKVATGTASIWTTTTFHLDTMERRWDQADEHSNREQHPLQARIPDSNHPTFGGQGVQDLGSHRDRYLSASEDIYVTMANANGESDDNPGHTAGNGPLGGIGLMDHLNVYTLRNLKITIANEGEANKPPGYGERAPVVGEVLGVHGKWFSLGYGLSASGLHGREYPSDVDFMVAMHHNWGPRTTPMEYERALQSKYEEDCRKVLAFKVQSACTEHQVTILVDRYRQLLQLSRQKRAQAFDALMVTINSYTTMHGKFAKLEVTGDECTPTHGDDGQHWDIANEVTW